MKIFSERLRALRKQSNLTQKKLGEKVGLLERGIRAYEINQTIPTLESIIKIADFFDVSIDYLVGRKDMP